LRAETEAIERELEGIRTFSRFELREAPPRPFFAPSNPFIAMQETVTLECTEARKEGKPVSRYLTKRNKKTVTERIEKKKYNPFLKRHTLHKEIK
jgi:large subunit ribosomal protein L33